MGCLRIKGTEDLVFYIYKELQLNQLRTGFDFSIHINIGDDPRVILTKALIDAHAYVKYNTDGNFTPFYECQINEKSYGHEYLNCHIKFSMQNDEILPIKKGDIVGIFYTYKVSKKHYGNEIGRQTSPFFEETLVELMYDKNIKLGFDCFEKIENSSMHIEGYNSNQIKPCSPSFLAKVLSEQELENYIVDKYNCGELPEYTIIDIIVPKFLDENGCRRLSHFYVRWRD